MKKLELMMEDGRGKRRRRRMERRGGQVMTSDHGQIRRAPGRR